jgi:hypothetical protein
MQEMPHRLARGIKNMRARFMKKHIQMSIKKLRDREQIVPELIHKSNIIQGEVNIYLDDASTKHLWNRGVRWVVSPHSN